MILLFVRNNLRDLFTFWEDEAAKSGEVVAKPTEPPQPEK